MEKQDTKKTKIDNIYLLSKLSTLRLEAYLLSDLLALSTLCATTLNAFHLHHHIILIIFIKSIISITKVS